MTVQGSIGFYGLFAGPDKFLVDRNALSDPLLARMPVSPNLYFEFYAGHYFRDIPEGYLESVGRNENLLTDPLLRDYYTHLRNVTRGPLSSVSRLRDIVALNVGSYRNLHEQLLERRSVALSIRADNERFLSDVGDRDPVAGALRDNSGRAGYLQFGPEIPVSKGVYRARWVGTVESAPAQSIGSVEIWFGDTRVTRESVTQTAGHPDHLLATLDFRIPEGGVRSLDYRFYVNEGVKMTLERVELFSGTAIPRTLP